MSTVVDESVHVKQHPDDFIGVSGMGKGSAGMLGKWAKIIVKISQTKCLLFNIFEKKLEKGFSSIKAPDKVKSKATVVLTSSE